jgi:hypothetical protein
VVPQRELVRPIELAKIVEHTPPHAGAEAARITLVALVEDDVAQLAAAYNVLYPTRRAKLRNRGIVCPNTAKTRVYRDDNELEIDAQELAKPQQPREKRDGILSAA